MQAFTPNVESGWSHTLAAVDRYFDRVLSDPQSEQPPSAGLWDEVPEPFRSVIEGVHLEFQHPRLVVANNVERSVAPILAKITASRI